MFYDEVYFFYHVDEIVFFLVEEVEPFFHECLF